MNIIRLNSIGEPFAKSGQATPPSGGGTEASSMEYLDLRELDANMLYPFAFIALVGRFYQEAGNPTTVISPLGGVLAESSSWISKMQMCAVDFSLKVATGMTGGVLMTCAEMLTKSGISADMVASIPRITEEQFYTL